MDNRCTHVLQFHNNQNGQQIATGVGCINLVSVVMSIKSDDLVGQHKDVECLDLRFTA